MPPFSAPSGILEKRADVICVVSFLALFYRMSVFFTSLSFGAPVPLCASPLLSAHVLSLLYLHIFPVSGYSSLLRYLVYSRLDINTGEHWN